MKTEDLREKSRAQHIIVEALAKMGKIKQALEYAQKIEGAGGNEDALNGIASALAQAGDFKQAWEVIKRIEDLDRQKSSLSGLAPFLAMEPISRTKMKSFGPLGVRPKKVFTTEENK